MRGVFPNRANGPWRCLVRIKEVAHVGFGASPRGGDPHRIGREGNRLIDSPAKGQAGDRRAQECVFVARRTFARKRSEILGFTIFICAFNTSHSFCIITTFKEFFYCSFYTYYPILAVLLHIKFIITFLKIWKVVFEYLLYNILLSWDIYRQKIFLIILCLI